MAVYGAAQTEYKEAFLTELSHLCAKELITYVDQPKKTMTISTIDGISFSIELLTLLTLEKFNFLEDDTHGPIIYRFQHMKS